MRTCILTLESVPGSPYSPSAQHEAEKHDRESHDDWDQRTWRLHTTENKDGQACVPQMAFKQAIDSAAWKLGMKVPNRRGATYKAFFASGFFVGQDVRLFDLDGEAWTKERADMVKINASSTGKRGGGNRVKRRYPIFEGWRGDLDCTIVDDIITPAVFEEHVRQSGIIVGVGRFRPENGGYNGRYRLIKAAWSEYEFAAAA